MEGGEIEAKTGPGREEMGPEQGERKEKRRPPHAATPEVQRAR